MEKCLSFGQPMIGRNVTRLKFDVNELNLNFSAKHGELSLVDHFMNKFCKKYREM